MGLGSSEFRSAVREGFDLIHFNGSRMRIFAFSVRNQAPPPPRLFESAERTPMLVHERVSTPLHFEASGH